VQALTKVLIERTIPQQTPGSIPARADEQAEQSISGDLPFCWLTWHSKNAPALLHKTLPTVSLNQEQNIVERTLAVAWVTNDQVMCVAESLAWATNDQAMFFAESLAPHCPRGNDSDYPSLNEIRKICGRRRGGDAPHVKTLVLTMMIQLAKTQLGPLCDHLSLT